MQLFENQRFEMLKDRAAGTIFSGMGFRDCVFDNCLLSNKNSDGRRSEVRHVELERCKFIGCTMGPAILCDVTVGNCSASDLAIFWGTLFRRVAFAGRVPAFKINRGIDLLPEAGAQARYDDSREAFYESPDWAIDISRARFTSFDCEGVPARLFRLDPETQGVVRRENVPSDWRTSFYASNAWGPWVAQLLAGPDADVVLAAPLAKPKKLRDRYLEDLRALRALGIVDPAA